MKTLTSDEFLDLFAKVCPKCGNLINSKSMLKRHAIQHENQTLLECQIPNEPAGGEASREVGAGSSGRHDDTPTEDKT